MAKHKPHTPWIAMRVNLERDPVVLELVKLEDVGDVDRAIGKLQRFWSWVYLEVGRARRARIKDVTLDHIDVMFGARGFAVTIAQRHWLVTLDGGGIEIPNYQRWFPQSVKDKQDAAERARRYRARKRHGASRDESQLPVPDRTGPDSTGQNINRTGTGAIDSRDENRTGPDRRRGNKTEQRNALTSALHREDVSAENWSKAWLLAIADRCQLAGAEYNDQRAALTAVAIRISQHPERAEIGAELIMLAQSKRVYVAKRGGNAWALWQKATEAFLKLKGV